MIKIKHGELKHTSKKSKLGFTILEVSLVLAIAGLLFIVLIQGTGTRIAQERYKDTVNDVVDYLRSTYASVFSVENVRETSEGANEYCTTADPHDGGYSKVDNEHNNYPGRSRCAIYGKLITFGESYDDGEYDGVHPEIHIYDIIGTIYEEDEKLNNGTWNANYDKTTIGSLGAVGANVVSIHKNSSGNYRLVTAGQSDVKTLPWEGQIQDAKGNIFRGAVAIVRSPSTNAYNTYIYSYKSPRNYFSDYDHFELDIQRAIAEQPSTSAANLIHQYGHKFLNAPIYNANTSSPTSTSRLYDNADLILCISTPDLESTNGRRRAVKIDAGGRDSSAIELLEADSKATEDACPVL